MAATAVAAVYAWWATGTRPFTLSAYVAVGLPVVLVGVTAVGPKGSGASRPPRHHPKGRWGASPWFVLLALAVGLECAALALGGRSTDVPTLSTVVDHALGSHAARFLLFSLWLAVGCTPVLPASYRQRSGAT